MRPARCDLLHPETETHLREYKRTAKQGRKAGTFKDCTECQRVRAWLRYHGKPIPQPVDKINTPQYTPYGVLPRLTWAPPQL